MNIEYKIYRNELNGKVCLCTQPFENKEQFKEICKNVNHEIYLNGKNITHKYRNKKEK